MVGIASFSARFTDQAGLRVTFTYSPNPKFRELESNVRNQVTFFFAALAISALAGAPPKEQYVGPDLKDGKVLVRSVTILPINTMVKLWGTGLQGELEPGEAKQLKASLSDYAIKILTVKGCHVPEDPFTAVALDNAPAIASALTIVQAQYKSLESQLFHKPKLVREGRYGMGEIVAKLNPGHTTDTFLFMDAFGALTTGSEKAQRVVKGPANTAKEALYLNLTLVDASTGSVLYFAKTTTGGNFIKDPGHVEHSLEDSLRDFTCASHTTE